MEYNDMTDWRTPPELFNFLHYECNFQVDAAADETNHLLDNWYGPGGSYHDALEVANWSSPAWCNPPYGRGIDRWLQKCYEQKCLGNSVVAIVPANTETQWWADWVVGKASMIFLVGRVPFIDPNRSKPSQPDHASVLLFYEPGDINPAEWCDWKKALERINSQI